MADIAPDLHLQAAQQRPRSLKPLGGVMIAGGDDYLDGPVHGRQSGKKPVISFLCGCRRVAAVENVAGDQKGVGTVLLDLTDHPVEKMTVLLQTVDAVEEIAQMPVAGAD